MSFAVPSDALTMFWAKLGKKADGRRNGQLVLTKSNKCNTLALLSPTVSAPHDPGGNNCMGSMRANLVVMLAGQPMYQG